MDVLPHGIERGGQLRVLLFEHQVCGSGKQIVGPHRVADRFALLREGNAVLVVIAAVGRGDAAHRE